MPSRSQSAITTYRALRMGVVAAALLLVATAIVAFVKHPALKDA